MNLRRITAGLLATLFCLQFAGCAGEEKKTSSNPPAQATAGLDASQTSTAESTNSASQSGGKRRDIGFVRNGGDERHGYKKADVVPHECRFNYDNRRAGQYENASSLSVIRFFPLEL